jgi:hypothetical protein
MRFFFLLIFLITALTSSAQKDITVQDVTSFDTSIGSQSAVNMSNGKLSMPLQLVSLKGFKDMNVQFGIAYDGSQVHKHAVASNEVIPTGVLGLGWGMQMPRILADNKLTAARDDDDFYLFEGGSLNELVATNSSSGKIEFRSKTYKPWKINFYPDQEKWEVIKENGYKYTYDHVDWVLYWENWIGNSNASGAERQGSGWSLTTVEDMYGNSISFGYSSVMRNLSGSPSSNQQHTEATYLQNITGPMGERVELIYVEKAIDEYYEPNTNSNEPDAYQEIYETKYLESVEVYDSKNQFLYEYEMQYETMGLGEHKKRLLTKVDLVNANGDVQVYREFEYDTDVASEFFGVLKHQILPTKGRISYQYATREIEVDQVLDISVNDDTSFVVQKDYIVKFAYLGSGYNSQLHMTRYDWDGMTWQATSLGALSSIHRIDGYLDAQVLAREDFFVILYRTNLGTYRRRAYGLKADGVTWDDFSSGIFHTPGVDNNEPVRLIGGDDFYAIGNPKEDRINMYRWNGNGWEQFYQYNNTPGSYYYTAANNYVIQHNEDTSPDTVKMFYYDSTNEVQQKTFNTNLETSGSGGHASFWYGANSFAQVNANANPEYFIRWDKNYNFLGRDNAFSPVPDNVSTYNFYNNYFSVVDWDYDSGLRGIRVQRYLGNGNWEYLESPVSLSRIDDENSSTIGFGQDFIASVIRKIRSDYRSNRISQYHVFNANSGSWSTHNLSDEFAWNYRREFYDVFGTKYAFIHNKIFKLNQNLSVSEHSSYDNTKFTKSDGYNALYLFGATGTALAGDYSPFAKLLSLDSKNLINEYDLPSGYELYKNQHKNFSSHALGYGNFIISNEDNTSVKIYKLIDGKLEYNSDGKTVQRDIVIAKETFDHVISRKQRKYYCFSNPKIDKGNMRVFYSTVIQQNDLNGVLGSVVSFYDKGDEDIRRQGLPLKTQTFDAQNNLLSKQESYWVLNNFVDGTYYINLGSKEAWSFEGGKELVTKDTYTYKPDNGLMYRHRMEDSEGRVHISETEYVYEIHPEVLDYNLLQPIARTKSYIDRPASEGGDFYKAATAVDWDVSAIPYPKNSYAWNGEGSTSFDFDSPPDNFREGQEIMLMDAFGNVLQEKNRSEVITSYLYGYGNKRLVAKIEGATHSEAIGLVSTSVLQNPTNDNQLINELQTLRNGLPDAFVTSYTYHVGIGMTSMTDVRGRMTRYEYDYFYRLDHVLNHEGHILKKNEYAYREAAFEYGAEPTDMLNCPLVNTEIVGDPNGEEPVPFSLRLSKQSGTDTDAFFVVTPRGVPTSGYNLEWNYNANSGNVSNFPYTIGGGGTNLSSTNPNCNDGVLSVSVKAVASNGTILALSNIVNHTYSSGPDCNPQ